MISNPCDNCPCDPCPCDPSDPCSNYGPCPCNPCLCHPNLDNPCDPIIDNPCNPIIDNPCNPIIDNPDDSCDQNDPCDPSLDNPYKSCSCNPCTCDPCLCDSNNPNDPCDPNKPNDTYDPNLENPNSDVPNASDPQLCDNCSCKNNYHNNYSHINPIFYPMFDYGNSKCPILKCPKFRECPYFFGTPCVPSWFASQPKYFSNTGNFINSKCPMFSSNGCPMLKCPKFQECPHYQKYFSHAENTTNNDGTVHSVRMTIEELSHAYTYNFFIPDSTPENIHVNIKNGMLCVSGESNSDINYKYSEIHGSFNRTVIIEPDAVLTGITANYNDGILIVDVLKRSDIFDDGEIEILVT
jgi:HSP20 family molecular chaperone IbpA